MKKLILIIFLCLLSICETQAQDVFGSGKNIRKGTKAALPALSEGELYWAFDENLLYIGGTNGSKKVVYLEDPTQYADGVSLIPRYESASGLSQVDLNTLLYRNFIVGEIGSGNSVTLNLQGTPPDGSIIMINIHKNATESWDFEFDGNAGEWENQGSPSAPVDGGTSVYEFHIFGGKWYAKVYGHGY